MSFRRGQGSCRRTEGKIPVSAFFVAETFTGTSGGVDIQKPSGDFVKSWTESMTNFRRPLHGRHHQVLEKPVKWPPEKGLKVNNAEARSRHPQKKALETEVDSVPCPDLKENSESCQTIPLLTTLDTGIVSYTNGSQKQILVVHWGYAQVEGERVTILAELAESVSEIDIDRASLQNQGPGYPFKIDMSSSDWESEKKRLDKYEFKLKRALVRQQAASLFKSLPK